jgi:hypothetical protein
VGGYYVSDAALDSLKPRNWPTAWLSSNTGRMSAAELDKLKSIAPVYDLATVTDWSTISSPLKFSPGACGFAFQDQHDESIILVWRQGRGPDSNDESAAGNTAMSCTVNFSTIKDGAYTVEELFDSANKYTVVISGGKRSFTFTLDRWDCMAFKSTIPSPNGSEDTGLRSDCMRNYRSHANGRAFATADFYTVQGRRIGRNDAKCMGIANRLRIAVEESQGIVRAQVLSGAAR